MSTATILKPKELTPQQISKLERLQRLMKRDENKLRFGWMGKLCFNLRRQAFKARYKEIKRGIL
jgi:hypothetical protein